MVATSRRTLALVTLAALGTVTLAQAAPPEFRTMQLAMEVPVKSITLPVTDTSPAVMPKCSDCPLASFPTTKETVYYERGRRIALSDLKALVLKYPQLLLTVSYTVKTGELVSIAADPPVIPR